MGAIMEIDIKKIIALSTLRQLGIIILILGLGNPILSFFHLLSHAFFKAILFMCAGIIIQNIMIKGKNLFLFFFLIIGTRLTVIYSCRLNFLVRINFLKSESLFFISENSIFIILGIIFLLPFSIMGGIIIS